MHLESHLDVARIQSELEAWARQSIDEPHFPLLDLQRRMPALVEASRVEPNPTLIGRTLYERIWVVINLTLRRIARHGVEPSVRSQNTFNAHARLALERLASGDAALHAELVRLSAERRHE